MRFYIRTENGQPFAVVADPKDMHAETWRHELNRAYDLNGKRVEYATVEAESTDTITTLRAENERLREALRSIDKCGVGACSICQHRASTALKGEGR